MHTKMKTFCIFLSRACFLLVLCNLVICFFVTYQHQLQPRVPRDYNGQAQVVHRSNNVSKFEALMLLRIRDHFLCLSNPLLLILSRLGGVGIATGGCAILLMDTVCCLLPLAATKQMICSHKL